jgi:hypothetical protein
VTLQFERCAIGVSGDEIKALFVRNEATEFPAIFQRAYSQTASAGGISWIARDGQGKLVGHYAALPRAFRSEGRQARAALLVDLLLDRVHRNFWSAAELCRRAAADLRDSGDFDFAYSDPSPVARGAMKAAGFTERGTLERFAAPLNPLYNGFFHLKSRAVSLTAERIDGLNDPRLAQALCALRPGAYFQGQRSLDLYATRLGLCTIPTWEWLLLRDPHAGATPCALALTAPEPGKSVLRILDVLWDDRSVSPASILRAVTCTARGQGYGRLNMVTLDHSALAGALNRCGFIGRGDTLPLFVLPLRQPDALPPLNDWVLTELDGSGW